MNNNMVKSPPANSIPHVQCSNDVTVNRNQTNYIEQASNDSDGDKAVSTTSGQSGQEISPNSYVKLNVGGSLHYTTMGTLTKEDNMLRAMFSGRMVVLSDKEGWVLIDRCGKHFNKILNYLRDGSVTLPDNRCEISELLAEAKYYLITGLASQCEKVLESKALDIDPTCRVPIITSSEEEHMIVGKTSIPIVKFLYNRGNNKYSYTNSSDDNMLKNIELFDKLSLRFNKRILFMKDIVGDEICVWSFYGHQRKVAEICCTSIVYATEKKQTKVEFPEARIYEETLNILLYEPNKPSTSSAGDEYRIVHADHGGENRNSAAAHNCQSDDDLDEAARNQQHRVRRIHVNSNRPV